MERTILTRHPRWLAGFVGINLSLQAMLIYQTGSDWLPGLVAGTAFICGVLTTPILLYLTYDRVYLEKDIEEEDE